MPRVARIVIPGLPHHVTQRGNNHQDVFFTDDDRRAYLEFVKREAVRWGLELLGYCLMTNHVHLVVVPAGEKSLSIALGRAHWRYSQYVNQLHHRSGHLWQNRFYSCPLDQPHLLAATAYLELNPVRAGLARTAFSYPWSSAEAHAGGTDAARLLNLELWRQYAPGLDWKKFVAGRNINKDGRLVRAHTLRGRPLVSDSELSKLEARLGRRLRPLPIGRPAKDKGKK